MLLSVGSKVRFLHTPDTGVVTALLEQGMVQVKLDGTQIEIPVFADDLEHADPSIFVRTPKKQASAPPAAPTELASALSLPAADPAGLHLAFDPVLRADATAEKYRIYLVNALPHRTIFHFQLRIDGEQIASEHGLLEAHSALRVGELFFDELNDNPEVFLDARRLSTQGSGPKQEHLLRIKPKRFFKQVQDTPFFPAPVHLFLLFPYLQDLQAASEQPPQEDLKTYTRQNVRPGIKQKLIERDTPHEVIEMAEFLPELDLHIERLTNAPESLSNAQVIQLQLRHFETYLDKAVRLGVERVFIIHGIGKGRLRDAIATRLINHPYVETFKNEYHPRYGHGATEVIFRGSRKWEGL